MASLSLFKIKLGFAQDQAWFCSRSCLVSLKINLGFVQDQAWFFKEARINPVR
jgi:hypothetical protein